MSALEGSYPADADAVLSLRESDLDVLIGSVISEGEFGSKGLNPAEIREIGQDWFFERISIFRAAVCTSPAVKSYLEPGSSTERELYDAILAALAFVTGIPVPLGILAAKVLRYGLDRLCPRTAGESTG